jgi:hypothetical protein
MMTTPEQPTFLLPLPRAGITLLPPWWLYLLWNTKRHENRAASVASRIKGWRGLFAFGASKLTALDKKDEAIMVHRSVREEPWFRWNSRKPDPFTFKQVFELGGHLVGVAELLDVVPNGSAPTGEWQEPGQHSLVLGRVWEIEPVPCSGGRGMCALGACAACGHIGSIENKGQPLVCRRCKVVTPREDLGRPSLRIRAEYSPTGEPQAFSLAASPTATIGQCPA